VEQDRSGSADNGARLVATAPPTPAQAGSALRLSELFGAVAVDDPVSGMTLDSRSVHAGDVYVALPGRWHHGAEFAGEAVRRGAVAVLTDPRGEHVAGVLARPVIVVDDPRAVMAGLAARIHGEPARAMTMYAITGTNGKTTTSFLVEAALRACGRRVGLIGTIGFLLDGQLVEGARTTVTTPESPELQALLARMRQGGADSVVMEVSSHALAVGRVDAIGFDAVAFTNFGRDHLDFHHDLESYFEAKALLFTAERAKTAVLNIDDPRGLELRRRCAMERVPVVTVSLEDHSADYTALRWPRAGGRTRVDARLAGRKLTFDLGLPGDFNVRNALTALALIDQAAGTLGPPRPGIDLAAAAHGLADARVPGRMQRVDLGDRAPQVYVDFAHTPQAVAAVLAALVDRRVVVVLGCGGDRDPQKRGPMGAAAARGAALVVVTDDNPRSEDPSAIRAEVLAGAREACERDGLDTEVVDGGDRRSAIGSALRAAAAGDVVAVLGKGHESGQEIGGRVLPFSDVEVIRQAWREVG
jgi:UDP-N-acetylmuramoyl-L-alanyl-D-glutamate--2,6-diaminopimelate ligase